MEESGFTVDQPAFRGTLQELGAALRSGSLAPSDLDLLGLVRAWLVHFEELAKGDLDVASEALPRIAQVIELKLRLLLPRPPREEQSAEDLTETLEAVTLLEDIEGIIDFLRRRREDRRIVFTARAQAPEFERRERPLGIAAGRLAELATRLRSQSYFELFQERLSFAEAARRLLAGLKARRRALFSEIRGDPEDWRTGTVMFAALLELLRQGRVTARQSRPYDEIEITLKN